MNPWDFVILGLSAILGAGCATYMLVTIAVRAIHNAGGIRIRIELGGSVKHEHWLPPGGIRMEQKGTIEHITKRED